MLIRLYYPEDADLMAARLLYGRAFPRIAGAALLARSRGGIPVIAMPDMGDPVYEEVYSRFSSVPPKERTMVLNIRGGADGKAIAFLNAFPVRQRSAVLRTFLRLSLSPYPDFLYFPSESVGWDKERQAFPITEGALLEKAGRKDSSKKSAEKDVPSSPKTGGPGKACVPKPGSLSSDIAAAAGGADMKDTENKEKGPPSPPPAQGIEKGTAADGAPDKAEKNRPDMEEPDSFTSGPVSSEDPGASGDPEGPNDSASDEAFALLSGMM